VKMGFHLDLTVIVLLMLIGYSVPIHDTNPMLMEDDMGVPCNTRNPCKCYNWQRKHANLTLWLAVRRRTKKATRCYLTFPSDCEYEEFQKDKPLHGWCASMRCNVTSKKCTKFVPPKPRGIVKAKSRLLGLGGNAPISAYLCSYMENFLVIVTVGFLFYYFF